MDDARPCFPRHLGKYRLDRLLGKGGMGEVYQAYDTTLHRVVALKTIRGENDDEQHAERFRREGRAAARLRHPLIVTIFELGEADGKLYLAMEYLEGESLAAALRAGRPGFEEKLDVLARVLEGLHHAHQNGVVHRDVKPSNVQLLPEGGLKILDFGIARLTAAETMSHTGLVLGTVPYMSPEQLRGERVDHRTDIYAAGVVGYEMLTGRRPFEGATLTEIVLKVIGEPLPPMDDPWTRRFPELERILARALEKDASARFETAAEMAAALKAVLPAPAAVSPAGASTTRQAWGTPGPAPPPRREPLPPAVPAPPSWTRPPAPPPTPPPVTPPLPPAVPPAPDARPRRWGRVAALAGGLLCMGGVLLAIRAGEPDGMRHSGTGPMPRPPLAEPRATPTPPAATAVPPAPPAEAALARDPAPRLSGDRLLAEALRQELASRRIRMAGARLEAHIDIALRPAPFAGSSALTADYAARAVLHGGGGAPLRCGVEGHALEFGARVVRAAAVRQAAARLADCLAPSRAR